MGQARKTIDHNNAQGVNYKKEGKISIKSYRNSFINVININNSNQGVVNKANTLRKSRHMTTDHSRESLNGNQNVSPVKTADDPNYSNITPSLKYKKKVPATV